MAFHLTQGTFSFLPPLTDDEIGKQVQYCLDNDWPINVEFTDDPHPRNTYWNMWGLPMFDVKDPAACGSLRPQQRSPNNRPLVHREPSEARSWFHPGAPGSI